MINNTKDIVKYYRSIFQSRFSSYKKHNSQFEQIEALEKHRIIYKKYHDEVLRHSKVIVSE